MPFRLPFLPPSAVAHHTAAYPHLPRTLPVQGQVQTLAWRRCASSLSTRTTCVTLLFPDASWSSTSARRRHVVLSMRRDTVELQWSKSIPLHFMHGDRTENDTIKTQ